MVNNILILLTVFLNNFNKPANSIDGTYIGLEKLCWKTDVNGNCIDTLELNPGFKWYHENTLKIKGDSIFMDQNPLSIKDNQKLFSASDGGFYYYKGTVIKKDKLYYFNFKELYCDYCPEEVEKQPNGTYTTVETEKTKQLIGKIENRKLIINGIVYTKTKPKLALVSETFKPESK
jgi:hypothetical protein